MPVSWQIGPSQEAASSMFSAMIDSAWADRVPSASASIAVRIAARTSGGRSVAVRVMSATRLSKKAGNMG